MKILKYFNLNNQNIVMQIFIFNQLNKAKNSLRLVLILKNDKHFLFFIYVKNYTFIFISFLIMKANTF